MSPRSVVKVKNSFTGRPEAASSSRSLRLSQSVRTVLPSASHTSTRLGVEAFEKVEMQYFIPRLGAIE